MIVFFYFRKNNIFEKRYYFFKRFNLDYCVKLKTKMLNWRNINTIFFIILFIYINTFLMFNRFRIFFFNFYFNVYRIISITFIMKFLITYKFKNFFTIWIKLYLIKNFKINKIRFDILINKIIKFFDQRLIL